MKLKFQELLPLPSGYKAKHRNEVRMTEPVCRMAEGWGEGLMRTVVLGSLRDFCLLGQKRKYYLHLYLMSGAMP